MHTNRRSYASMVSSSTLWRRALLTALKVVAIRFSRVDILGSVAIVGMMADRFPTSGRFLSLTPPVRVSDCIVCSFSITPLFRLSIVCLSFQSRFRSSNEIPSFSIRAFNCSTFATFALRSAFAFAIIVLVMMAFSRLVSVIRPAM